MYKLLILFLMCLSVVQAQDLDELLGEYKVASDLSNKTKNEAAGSLIVYTRSDIERMQANTLEDLLKTMRFWTYQESRLAQPDMLNQDPLTYSSSSVRIYLNEHELFNPLMGSGFTLFGSIELDFIDHVEVYQGFPSFEFGSEPATIVIRLYSKTSEHDTGGKVKVQAGSYGSSSASTYYADVLDNGLSYFAYASHRDIKRHEINVEGQNLKKDRRTQRAYFSLASENHSIELHASEITSDGFLGGMLSTTTPLSLANASTVPSHTDVDNRYLSLATHSTFQDKSLIATLSVIQSTSDIDMDYATPFSYRPLNVNGAKQVHLNSSYSKVKEDSYTLGLIKKFESDKNTFTTGVKFRHNKYNFTDTQTNGVSNVNVVAPPGAPVLVPVPFTSNNSAQAYDSTDIYTLFIEDSYSVNENNLVTASLMGQHYHNRHTKVVDNQTLWQGRLGYVFSDEQWVSKSFASYAELNPSPTELVTTGANFANVNLDPSKYFAFIQEVSYEQDRFLSKVLLSYVRNEDLPVIDANTFVLENSNENIKFYLASFEETIHFSSDDKLELQAYVTMIDVPSEKGLSAAHGGMVQMLNSFEKLDLFNQFLVREKVATGTDNAYEYSLGLIYHVSKDFSVNVKGENIFDSGYEQSYFTNITLDGSPTPATQSVVTTTSERRFWFGMELLF